MVNVNLNGDSKTAAIVKRIFGDCNVWDCSSHTLVNFRKRLTDLGNHEVGEDRPTAWFGGLFPRLGALKEPPSFPTY